MAMAIWNTLVRDALLIINFCYQRIQIYYELSSWYIIFYYNIVCPKYLLSTLEVM